MKLDESYFMDEVREGYYIPGMIKRSWANQLAVLDMIASICKKHDIKWFADCGTLLGAIRHHGYIPWDDDLDICMLHDDYDRFIKIAHEELPEEYCIQNNYSNENDCMFITRIADRDSVDISPEELEKHYGFPYISGVDVFPLRKLFNDEAKEEDRLKKFKKVADLLNDLSNGKVNMDLDSFRKKIEAVSGYSVRKDLPLENAIYRIFDQIFNEASEEEAEAVALMSYWVLDKSHKYPVDLFNDVILIPFEYTEIMVPAAYEKILRIEYGNWEVPFRGGGTHGYPGFANYEIAFEKAIGGKLPYKYYYESINEDKRRDTDIVDLALKSIQKAHGSLGELLEIKDYENVLILLESCQQLAIKAGEEIEHRSIHDGDHIVKVLETYCEDVFAFGEEMMAEDFVAKERVAALVEKINFAFNVYDHITDINGDIVFVSVGPNKWRFFDEIYKSKILNQDRNVVVLVIPRYNKGLLGSIFGEEQYEINGYPEYVNIYDYREYDFALKRPAEIYIQEPFDSYASNITIHPSFYSSVLKNYTRRLIYVQSFDIDDIEKDDEKGYYTARNFIISPGVINSDEIIVRSDALRKLYIDILSDFTDIDHIQLEEKVVFNSSYIDTIRIQKESAKKTILFYVSFSSMYENTKKALAKIKKALDTFKENSGRVRIIWAEDENFEHNMMDIRSEYYDEYARIKEDSKNILSAEHIYSGDLLNVIDKCDAFYGSPGYAMNISLRNKIPVMEWSIDT